MYYEGDPFRPISKPFLCRAYDQSDLERYWAVIYGQEGWASRSIWMVPGTWGT